MNFMPQKWCLLYAYHSAHLLKLRMATHRRERLKGRGDREGQVQGVGVVCAVVSVHHTKGK